MKFKNLLLLISLSISLTACFQRVEPVIPEEELFNWETISVWSLNVTGDIEGVKENMVSIVNIYSGELSIEQSDEMSLISKSTKSKGKDISIPLSLPLALDNIFVSVISPEGKNRVYRLPVDRNNSAISLDLTSANEYEPTTKSVGEYTPPSITIPTTFDYIINADNPNFPDKLEDGKTYLVERGFEATMSNPVSTLNSIWNYNTKTHKIYVAGTLNIPDFKDANNSQKISGVSFIILNGGVLNAEDFRFRDAGTNYASHPAMYIEPTGVVNINGSFVLGPGKTLIVKGYMTCGKFSSGRNSNVHVSGRLESIGHMSFPWVNDQPSYGGWGEVHIYAGGLLDAPEGGYPGSVDFYIHKDGIARWYKMNTQGTRFITPQGSEWGLLIADTHSGGTSYYSFEGPTEVFFKSMGARDYFKSSLEKRVDGTGAVLVDSYENRRYFIAGNEYNKGYGEFEILDKDGDTVPGNIDIDDNDPSVAYRSYFPSINDYATVMFEDLWPLIGDYDMNDLVTDFRIEWSSNAKNRVVSMDIIWQLRAAGTMQNMALAFQLDDITPQEISKVERTLNVVGTTPFVTGASGLESGQSKAVVPLFNAISDVCSQTMMLNVFQELSFAPVPYHRVRVEFANPVDPSRITIDKFNIFIVTSSAASDNKRGVEIHLPGFKVTDKGKTVDANTLSEKDKFIGVNGMMWGLMVPQSVPYTQEYTNIGDVYLNFDKWYKSFGEKSKDWYKSSSGSVNGSKIFTTPSGE